jgi:hypothetical protein
MKKIIFLLCFFYFQSVAAQEIPVEIKQDFINPQMAGTANLRVYGLNIYDVWLWKEQEKNHQNNLAIRVKYNRNFSQKELVNASVKEIARIQKVSKKKAESYRAELNRLLRGVKKGDVKTAFYSDKGLAIYKNSQLIGVSNDLVLGRYFIDIWLNPRTKYPKIRNQLINGKK